MTRHALTVGRPIHSVRSAGSSRLSLFRLLTVAGLAYAVLDVAWLSYRWGGPGATNAFADISSAACAWAAACACLNAWRIETPERRGAWGLLALASLCWAAGEVIWTHYELALVQEPPFPSAADGLYLTAYPLAALGILWLPTAPRDVSSRVRTLLDALIVGVAFLLASLAWFVGTIFERSSEGSLFAQSVGLAYPMSDVVLAAVAIFVFSRARAGRRTTLGFLAAGLIALAVADSAFAYLTLIDAYVPGSPTDAAWDIGYLLIAFAAIRHDPSAPRAERSDEQSISVLFPYAPVVLAVVLAFVHGVDDGPLGRLLLWGVLLVVLLVVVRQLVTLLDNVRLLRNLEGKVRERTAELARSEERHRSLVQNSSDVVLILDANGIVSDVTGSCARVLGVPAPSLVGRMLVDVAHSDDRPTVDAYLKRFMGKPGDAPTLEWRIRDREGNWRYCESVGTNMFADDAVAGFVLNTRDVTERKQLELALRHQAFHDALTGSANRALFRDRAEHALKRAARNRKPIAVLFCDLDNLKEVNDRYGHEVGDRLLTEIAERLQACIRAEDTVARLGGDEFAVLLTDGANEASAKHVASRLLASLEEPFRIDEHAISTSVSIGIAISWGRQDVDELLRNADIAMYEAKNRGKARYELFEPEPLRTTTAT